MYDDASTVVINSIQALGTKALVVLGAAVVVAGSVFIIKWGFKKAKSALDGNIGYDPVLSMQKMHFKDEMEIDAYIEGRSKFRKEGFTFND